MTTSQWDKQELDKNFPGCRNLKQIIDQIESDFSMKGEVICEIRVNGMLLSEADESKFAESLVQEITELSVRSNRPADLIMEALESARTLSPDLEAACLKTADAFRGHDLNAAQKMFHELLEGCQWMIDTIIHIRGAASGIGEPIAHPERWFEAEKVIAKVINDVNESYTNNDYVLVADLLEYELTVALAIWYEALSTERAQRKT